jgi:hypothetical protein
MEVSFLTWNLALMARSAQAPQHWEMFDTEAHVRSEILRLQPDVVLFQELPGLVPFVETHAMVGPNPRTHSGNLAILVKNALAEPDLQWLTVGSFASAVTVNGLTIANVHLVSGPGAGSDRTEQLAQVVAKSPTRALVIAGDTNTRVDEETKIGELGLKTQRPPRATWNSKFNRFNHKGPEFSAYFSRWFVTSDVTVTKPWVADSQPVEAANKRFFVSDHFACGATVSAGG